MAEIPVAAIIALAAAVVVIALRACYGGRPLPGRWPSSSLARVALPILIVIPALLLAALSYHSEANRSGSGRRSGIRKIPIRPCPAARTIATKPTEAEKAKEDATRRYEMQREEEEGAMKPGAPARRRDAKSCRTPRRGGRPTRSSPDSGTTD